MTSISGHSVWTKLFYILLVFEISFGNNVVNQPIKGHKVHLHC